MIIDLDEKTRIVGTEDCWTIQRLPEKKPDSKNDPEWRTATYHTTFDSALSAALQREIRIHPAHGVAEAIEAIEALTARYTAIFDITDQINEARFGE